MTDALLAAAGAILALMLATWLVSLPLRDASIVDMIWGLGFVIATWAAFLVTGDVGARGWLIAALVTIWGFRLSGYLIWRNAGKGEDYRYALMREKSDRFWLASLYKVFALQGALMWLVAVPAVVTQTSTTSLWWLDYAGASVWAIGVSFESVADFQLSRFKARPQNEGKVLDRGLWRYTRHPNYFGDFCVWWGVYLIGLAGGAWWSVFSPLVMTALLMRYSGAGLLEKTIGDRRPAYAEYIASTNTFFPGPRRSS